MRCLCFLAVIATSAAAQSATSAAVANYAGFTGAAPVAPGSIASAYGTFGSVAIASASTLTPMPKEISGIRVRVAGQDVPLYFVSSGQINFVVPVSAAPGRHEVEVLQGPNVIARGSVVVWDLGPGLAVSNPSPESMQGIVQNQDFSVNGLNARAKRGEIIQIYATGCGQTNPGLPEGAPPTQLSTAVANVQVFVANERANVSFAGAHPLFPGVCQINAAVPDKGYITGQTPLYFTVNGLPSNQVSFWVE